METKRDQTEWREGMSVFPAGQSGLMIRILTGKSKCMRKWSLSYVHSIHTVLIMVHCMLLERGEKLQLFGHSFFSLSPPLPPLSMFGCSGFFLRPPRCSNILLTSFALSARCIPRVPSRRQFHNTIAMSNLSVELTAPNGRTYTQPIGLFINNEFVPSKSGEKIASVNPSYAPMDVCRAGTKL